MRVPPDPQPRATDWRARVANAVSRGGHVVYESDTEVHVVEGKAVNHVLHLLLTVFTLGLWIIPWIILVATGGERRYAIQKSAAPGGGAPRSTSQPTSARAGGGVAGAGWVRHYLHECADCSREGPACREGRDLWAAR